MSWNNRVVWSEGMFITTQHFQQHDRYLEHLVDARNRPLSVAAWGVLRAAARPGPACPGQGGDSQRPRLAARRHAVRHPRDDLPPAPLEVPDDLRDGVVHLGLPLKRAGARDTVDEGEAVAGARYVSRVSEVRDDNAPFENRAPLALGSRACACCAARTA